MKGGTVLRNMLRGSLKKFITICISQFQMKRKFILLFRAVCFIDEPSTANTYYQYNKDQHSYLNIWHYALPPASCSRNCPQAAEISSPLDSRMVQCSPLLVKYS